MKKILIVDDEHAITDGLTALFELEQIDASGAYDRESAEVLIAENHYAVIIADLRLRTQEEGLRLLDSIRKISPGSRVASLTAFATAEVEQELKRRGSGIVLRKPMDFDEIVAIVLEMLQTIEQEAIAQEALTQAPLDLELLYRDVRKILHAIPQRRYGLSPDETDELVQEAWCLFLEKRDSVRNVRSWLAGTVVNLARQQIHQKCRFRKIEEEVQLDGDGVGANENEPIEREQTLMLRQALSRIDERSRDLCVRIGLEGWSYEEVAAGLTMPLGSVGPLYIRAKKKLRAALETGH